MGDKIKAIYQDSLNLLINSIHPNPIPDLPLDELEWIFLKTILLIKIQNFIPKLNVPNSISLYEFDIQLNELIEYPLENLRLFPKKVNLEKMKLFEINSVQYFSHIVPLLNDLFEYIKFPDYLNMADQLGLILENRHLELQKKTRQTGIYYTPQAEQRFMLYYTIVNWVLRNPNKMKIAINSSSESLTLDQIIQEFFLSPKIGKKDKDGSMQCMLLSDLIIIDPCCGNGEFVLTAMAIFTELIQSKIMILPTEAKIYLVGVDLDPQALLIAELRVLMRKNTLEHQMKNIFQFISIHCDFLLSHDVIMNKISSFLPKFEGFDIIVGNPPYIRPRDLADPSGNEITKNEIYRKAIIDSVLALSFSPEEIDGHSDYYLYFYYHAINLLALNGILGFITSNSWLNVKFGYPFQKFLLQYCHILQCFDNTSKSFEHAEINPAILLVSLKPNSNVDLSSFYSQFIRWQEPYKDLCSQDWVHLLHQGEILEDKDLKLKLITHKIGRVLQLVQNQISHGYQWGNYYFMAPPFFLRLLAEIGTTCDFLSSYASVNRGITTNCNDFFILKRIGPDQYQNGFGDLITLPSQVLVPIIESPRNFDYPILTEKELTSYLFYTNLSKPQLKAQNLENVLKYVEYGEKVPIKASKGTIKGNLIDGVISLPTFKPKYEKSPDSWYCLKSKTINHEERTPAHIFFQKIYDTTFKIFYSEDELISNNTFYEVRLKLDCPINSFQLFAILSGSLTTLCLELNGRTNFGGGAIDTATFDIEKILIPKINNISKADWEKIINIILIYTKRKLYNFTEEQKQEDKKMLDGYILNVLKNPISIHQLYRSIQDIQTIRVKKSKS
jgi:hypothetical protein